MTSWYQAWAKLAIVKLTDMSLSAPLGGGAVRSTLPRTRFDSYENAAQASSVNPEALYLWGTRMAGAIQEALSITEIYVRNAIDEELKKAPGADQQWIANYASVPHLCEIRNSKGNPYFRERFLKEQVRRSRRGYEDHQTSRRTITHDDLVSHATFGSWATLLPDRWEKDQKRKAAREVLWRESLARSLPGRIESAARKSSIGETVGEYVRIAVHLRNRANHADSLLNIDVLDSFQRFVVPLVSAIDPELGPARVLETIERVESTWLLRPCALSSPPYDLRAAARS